MVLLILAAAFLLAGSAHADQPASETPESPSAIREPSDETVLAVGLGAEYSEGDFGLPGESRFAASTLRFRLSHGPWTARVAVPYQYTSGNGNVVGPPDAPVICNSEDDNSGPGNAEDRCQAQSSAPSTTTTHRSHEHGIGDVTLALLYTIEPIREYLPYVELGVKAKFATADADKGLGTGRNDYTLGIEMDKSFGPVTPYVAVGYRFVGNPAGLELRDMVLVSGGLTYEVGDALDLGVAYDYRSHSSRGADDSHELGPFASWKLTRNWRVGGYASFGLSDGAPDWSAGTNVTYTFR